MVVKVSPFRSGCIVQTVKQSLCRRCFSFPDRRDVKSVSHYAYTSTPVHLVQGATPPAFPAFPQEIGLVLIPFTYFFKRVFGFTVA